MKNFDNIFREYDIRGIFEKELNEKSVKAIGLSLGEVFKEKGVKKVSIGYDARLSGEEIFKYLISGLNFHNLEIYDIGMLPTPVGYFSVFTKLFDANIMITGSHNPKNYNGFKITIGKDSFFGEDLQNLKIKVKENLSSNLIIKDDFRAKNFDVLSKYLNYLAENFSHLKNLNLKIACDCANATAGIVLEPLKKALNLDMKILFSNPDGNFPNHHPDPSVNENLQDLKKELKDGFDIGFGFDGDSDRIAVLTKENNIKGDELAYLFALNLKEPKIVGEVKFSQNIYEIINKFGSTFIAKTGHSHIKKFLKNSDCDLGAEVSGHIFFNDRYFGFDDAIYAMLRVLEIIHYGTNLDLELSKLPKVYTTDEIKIDVDENDKFKIIDIFKEHINELNLPPIKEIIDIDGIRVHFDNGAWALLRASNTTPCLVARFEANDEYLKDEIRDKFMKLVNDIKFSL
ncbi:phosphomannomutase/phosphoglucomutase [Campylobacter sp. FMV-PI01]|uniref:Phosphomannomutase/phosphoglucomutase n=1 Tax=Campylobacter portucalensis TaxID=2608384 RepID=A0A6L5WGM3_9BACT|nr:phosphomannomutase/phosphoglucomutase [Campylobacter portucalensis]MSN96320.1 phosphomannomutase/phosphoglucomutase [Campylobacter portucalensis]